MTKNMRFIHIRNKYVQEQDVVIGAAIVGPEATDLLAELTLAVHFGLTAEVLGDVIHPHPTLSQAIMENQSIRFRYDYKIIKKLDIII